jgi:hypothetical protein
LRNQFSSDSDDDSETEDWQSWCTYKALLEESERIYFAARDVLDEALILRCTRPYPVNSADEKRLESLFEACRNAEAEVQSTTSMYAHACSMRGYHRADTRLRPVRKSLHSDR